MSDSEQITVYQLKIFILGISPMIWRRFKVHSNSTITDLHYIVQIVMGWTDSQATFSGEASPERLAHLHRFVIHGKDYGIAQIGGIWFAECLHCENQLLHKDKRTIVYRTLFGKLHIKSHRLFHCKCQEQPTRSFNPVAKLLTERTSPELLYLGSADKKSFAKSNFEVIIGKSIKADGTSRQFGGVYCYDTKPQRRIFEVLKSQGMQMNQQVTFLSNGDNKLRELQLYLNPNAEYLLDWFHITMRLTVMSQMAKGINQTDPASDIPKQL
jgi:Plasmid pRiA4b ORF-3-like protein